MAWSEWGSDDGNKKEKAKEARNPKSEASWLIRIEN
jgi:hypothetical protein